MRLLRANWPVNKRTKESEYARGNTLGVQLPVQMGKQADCQLATSPAWTYEAESAVCQSRENTTCPPAAVDSFALRAVEQIRRAGMLALVFASVVMLTACTVSSPQAANENQVPANTQETATPYSPQSAEPKANPTEEPKEIAEQPKSSDSPSEEPKLKVEKSADYGGVAYEAQGDGPQLVQRSGKTVKAADRLTATAESGTHATYKDGVSVQVTAAGGSTVKSEGPGYFTGASYKVFEIEIDNESDAILDLSSVLVSLLLGDKREIAIPLYGEVEAYDFSGTLEPGQQTSTEYAFIVPKGNAQAQLHVDIDNAHAPGKFTVKTEQK